ncbi:MAG: peptidoglycan DD-metalloendopeptidase family protein [Motiliproteus sp.]|nr:peptidoglycan DD-metalloendopeptidase family protein [Motiliproteus sp.]MCW9050775.1 peptidoglycan DD-metalloendopeptidase family protein [Motiliproteus sp.]
MKSLVSALLLTFLAFNSYGLELPKQAAVAGGIVHIPLQGNSSTPPKVIYNKHRVMVVPSHNTPYQAKVDWVALVGIPLSAKTGQQTLTVDGKKQHFKIQGKQYKEQRLTIKNKRKVNPNPLDMKRINREKKEIITAIASWTDTDTPATQLLKPAKGPYSSPFGLRRFFNNQPRKPHSGLDIAAPKGSPIIAPAPGKVVATGDYFFNGRTVILDHGQGLTTMYCHMDQIHVKLGQLIPQGEQLGTIGSTGRVTGPHLHWGVSLNNARIDPMLMMVEQ